MLVVIANDLPPAVRGRMKLWFIEPRPNVFVSGVNDAVADSVVEYLYQHCPVESGIMVFQKTKKVPGYKIRGLGLPGREIVLFDGMQLIQEKAGKAPTI
jgi:CRISPR-associated protein Cas2